MINVTTRIVSLGLPNTRVILLLFIYRMIKYAEIAYVTCKLRYLLVMDCFLCYAFLAGRAYVKRRIVLTLLDQNLMDCKVLM